MERIVKVVKSIVPASRWNLHKNDPLFNVEHTKIINDHVFYCLFENAEIPWKYLSKLEKK